MAQHTDPGAIPLGARPLRIYNDEDEQNGDGKSESGSVASSLLDGIDVNKVAARDSNVDRRKGVRRCRKCRGNYKPPRSHHDSVTGRCISKFDHFCPWIGNAVGALNHKFFVLFIFYTFLNSGLSMVLIIMRFVRCGYTKDADADVFTSGSKSNWNNETISSYTNFNVSDSTDDRYTIKNDTDIGMRLLEGENQTFLYEGCEELYSMQVISLLVVTFSFLIFTCCMLFEQIDAIESNTSKIARMKMRMGQDDGEYGKVAMGFNEMFGVGIGSRGAHVGLHWFLPTQVEFPSERDRDEVLGYEYREEWAGSVYNEDLEEARCTLAAPATGLRSGNSNGRKTISGSLMASDDEFDDNSNMVVEIELPAGDSMHLSGSNRRNSTVSRRSSKLEDDSTPDHSVRIV